MLRTVLNYAAPSPSYGVRRVEHFYVDGVEQDELPQVEALVSVEGKRVVERALGGRRAAALCICSS